MYLVKRNKLTSLTAKNITKVHCNLHLVDRVENMIMTSMKLVIIFV